MVKQRDSSSLGSENPALVTHHELTASATRTDSWIVNSRATCHMCNNEKLFVEFRSLQKPLEVTLGDGHILEATGRGIVPLEMKLLNCKTVSCRVQDVLFLC